MANLSKFPAAEVVDLVRGVVPTLAGVRATKHSRHGHGSGKRLGPADPRPGRAIARVVVLGIVDGRGVSVRVPDDPAFGPDDRAHGRVLEHHACIRAPGSPEVVSAARDGLAGGGGDVAVVEEVV